MNFVQAVKTVLKNYVTFSGRAVRSEYWYWYLFCLVISILTTFVDNAVFHISSTDPTAVHPINLVFTLLVLLPSFAVGVRRLHDVDRSGWWLLISLTIVGIIPLLFWFCTKGTPGANRFGPEAG